MIFHALLIKYAEIAIKGKNRYIFEDALVSQIRNQDAYMCTARRSMTMMRP